ncbi:MAG: ABC transporter substrate-binding protein [Acholeplasma sp.]
MKKVFLSIVIGLATVLLAACGPTDDRPVLTYAGWNLGTVEQNNIERQMLTAFQADNPDIRIEVIPRPIQINEDGTETDIGWFDFFSTRASTGNLPDVFQVADITTWIVQGWLDDVSDLVEDDPDFALVPTDIAHDAKYDEFLFALPQAMFYYGFFINRTVYEGMSNSQDIEYGISLDDLMTAAKANSMYDFAGEGSGIAGIDGMNTLIEWLPAQFDDQLDWFTFNADNGYHLDSSAFESALNKQKEFITTSFDMNYILNNMNDDDRSAQYGTSDPWLVGKQSVKWAASYNLRDWVAFTKDESHPLFGHDIDFIGTPSIEGTHKIPIIMDHLGIARGSENRQKAYELAKWMSFGVDGFNKRIEITKENPVSGAINFAPFTQDTELIESYFELYPQMTEFKKIVETHQFFIRESLWKTTPGYWTSRANGGYDETTSMGDMINGIIEGTVAYADVKTNLNARANFHWNQSKTQFDQAIINYRNQVANNS